MIPWLDSNDPDCRFPPPANAQTEPNGLLAAGGDLSVRWLLSAYRAGIFPWFSEGDPIMWWCPDPRLVLPTNQVHQSRRLRRSMSQGRFGFCVDRSFEQVVSACAAPRSGQPGTWITKQMMAAYLDLHRRGHAHSLEVYRQGTLVGGIYGVAIGSLFFGESMFHRCSNASKLALVWLCQLLAFNGFDLLDCQIESAHLLSMGAQSIPRGHFLEQIRRYCSKSSAIGDWHSPPLPVELARYFLQDGPYGQS